MTKFEQEIEDKVKAEKDEELRADKTTQLINAFKIVLSSSEGKQVIDFITKLAPIEQITFSSEPMQMAFNEGRRSLIVDLTNFIKVQVTQ